MDIQLYTMQITLELPDDVFDREFTSDAFVTRLREIAILELLKVKRLHEHEALQMLGLERWELLDKMEAAGITPTEKAFGAIKDELESAIAGARKRRGSPERG